MRAILDTSIFVGVERLRLDIAVVPAEGVLSAITLEELKLGFGSATHSDLARRTATFARALDYDIVPVSREIAELSAEIRAEGRARGRRYGLANALIGATGRLLDLPVYTQDSGFEGMAGVDVHVV